MLTLGQIFLINFLLPIVAMNDSSRASFVFSGAALLCFSVVSHAADKRPNILFCVADDAGRFSAYGHKWVNTPNGGDVG